MAFPNPKYDYIKPGMKFGTLTVLGRSKGDWEMQCDCGKVVRAKSKAVERRKCYCNKPEIPPVGDIMDGRRIISTKEYTTLLRCIVVQCETCGLIAKVKPNKGTKCANCFPLRRDTETSGSVYAITDPFSGKIMYVGATNSKLNNRLKKHWTRKDKKSTAHRPLYVWLRKLDAMSAYPGMIELEHCNENLWEREMFWIKKLSSEGILNQTGTK